MSDMLGDDVLPSDYDPSLGQTWPGVDTSTLPEIFRTRPQPGPDGLLPYPPVYDPRGGEPEVDTTEPQGDGASDPEGRV
jgi:hypothetical protein